MAINIPTGILRLLEVQAPGLNDPKVVQYCVEFESDERYNPITSLDSFRCHLQIEATGPVILVVGQIERKDSNDGFTGKARSIEIKPLNSKPTVITAAQFVVLQALDIDFGNLEW